MKILISAYACEPGKGSEPEVGLRLVLAAALEHQVWVLTRKNNVNALRDALSEAGRIGSVEIVGIDLPGSALRLKKAGLPFLHWYYDRWQRAAARVAVRLDRQVDFDLVHHATFATYWARTGVAAVGKPLVWGPVGGGARTPRGLLPTLGPVGLADEAARVGIRPIAAFMNGARGTARDAGIVIAQNPDTLDALGSPPNAVVLPNALSVDVGRVSPRDSAGEDIVFAGRLIPLKAVTLAVDAVAQLRHGEAVLHIYGDGRDRRRLDRRVAKHGIEGRVRVHGQVPRDRLLTAMASSRVLIHPALHDEASLTVAEALSLGTRVVALDQAGPAAIAAHWPPAMSRLVTPTTPDATARNLARAVDAILDEDPDVNAPISQFDFGEALLGIYRSVYEASQASPEL